MSHLSPPDVATTSRAIAPHECDQARALIRSIATAFDATVVGQRGVRVSLLTMLMTGGHVLLESVPGLAKTTAASTLAGAVRGTFSRIQCTPDLLPSDIIGTQVFDSRTASFSTQLGPVHANIVLLDEINRSSAKTQSAMLEAMQERQTSIAGETHRLPDPFCVIATQNPIDEEGTYVLPEAQMDRFLLKEVLTYPTLDDEIEVLRRSDTSTPGGVDAPRAVATLDDVRKLRELTSRVYVDDAIRHYIASLVAATRRPEAYLEPKLARYVQYGASPRGGIALQQVARALALMAGRSYVTPDDVVALRHSVLRHRIRLTFEGVADGIRPEAVIDQVFRAVPTP